MTDEEKRIWDSATPEMQQSCRDGKAFFLDAEQEANMKSGRPFIHSKPPDPTQEILTRLDKLTAAVAELQAAVKSKPLLVKLDGRASGDECKQVADAIRRLLPSGEALVYSGGMEVVSPTGYRIEVEMDGSKCAWEAPTLEGVMQLYREAGKIDTPTGTPSVFIENVSDGWDSHVRGSTPTIVESSP